MIIDKLCSWWWNGLVFKSHENKFWKINLFFHRAILRNIKKIKIFLYNIFNLHEWEKQEKHYGDLMPIEEWIEHCESNFFIDYDGFGDFIRFESEACLVCLNFEAKPSLRNHIPKGTTHVRWYNR